MCTDEPRLPQRIPTGADLYRETFAEEQLTLRKARTYLKLLKVNVDNTELSDADFRNVVRNTIKAYEITTQDLLIP